ncbi:MAG: SRPBCC family protein [Balneolaceae bacterium]|nr:SRPBCC family protein [Balneolaceae bacterium]
MKYVGIIIGCLVLLAGGVYLTGYMLPENHSVTVSREIEAPRNKAWERISTPSAFPAWRSTVNSVEVYSDSTVPLHWKESYSNNHPITFREARQIKDTLFVSRIVDKNLPFGGEWSISLDSLDMSRTQVTITENGEIYSPIFRFFARFVFGYDDTIHQYLDDLEASL